MNSVFDGSLMARLVDEQWKRRHPYQAKARAAWRWLVSDEERVRWAVWALVLVAYVAALVALKSK